MHDLYIYIYIYIYIYRHKAKGRPILKQDSEANIWAQEG